MLNTDQRWARSSGFTLVELLVVMVILGVVGTVVVSAIASSLESSSRSAARVEALQELEVTTQRATRDIRSADQLIVREGADPANELAMRVSLNNEIVRLRYRLDTTGGQSVFVQEQIDETNLAITERRLVTEVDNSGEPIFRYFRTDGSEITTCGDVPSDCTRATRIELRLVRSLGEQRDIEVATSVNIRSFRYEGVPS